MKQLLKILSGLGFLLAFGSCSASHIGGTQNPVKGHTVTLSWVASTTTGIDGYNVYRANQSGGPYTIVGSTNANALTYVDSHVASGSTYYYVATAFILSPAAESVFSGEVTAAIPTP